MSSFDVGTDVQHNQQKALDIIIAGLVKSRKLRNWESFLDIAMREGWWTGKIWHTQTVIKETVMEWESQQKVSFSHFESSFDVVIDKHKNLSI